MQEVSENLNFHAHLSLSREDFKRYPKFDPITITFIWKVYLRCKGKTLLGVVNKILKINGHLHVCERNYFFAAERKSGGEKGLCVPVLVCAA
jgi:hypothetical protein